MSYTLNPAQSSTPATLSTLRDKTLLLTTVYADPRLKASDKVVMSALLLVFHNGVTGRCFPSLAAIGDATRLSERHIRNSMRRLRECGYVIVLRQRGLSNRYLPRHWSAAPPGTGVPPNIRSEHTKKKFTERKKEEGAAI